MVMWYKIGLRSKTLCSGNKIIDLGNKRIILGNRIIGFGEQNERPGKSNY